MAANSCGSVKPAATISFSSAPIRRRVVRARGRTARLVPVGRAADPAPWGACRARREHIEVKIVDNP